MLLHGVTLLLLFFLLSVPPVRCAELKSEETGSGEGVASAWPSSSLAESSKKPSVSCAISGVKGTATFFVVAFATREADRRSAPSMPGASVAGRRRACFTKLLFGFSFSSHDLLTSENDCLFVDAAFFIAASLRW